MGTLFSQQERNYRSVSNESVDGFLKDAAKLAKKHNVTVADVIATATLLQLERKNDLYVANGDIHDEQMAGVGEILQRIATALERDQ
jgi:hypothetical protein